MTDSIKLQKISEYLKKLEAPKLLNEIEAEIMNEGYLDINDFCGGNIDDAYSIGEEYSAAEVARDLLKIIEKH